jgi:hypothetical protein
MTRSSSQALSAYNFELETKAWQHEKTSDVRSLTSVSQCWSSARQAVRILMLFFGETD